VHEESVFRKCGAREVPQLVLILDNHYFLYRDHSFTPQKVVGKFYLTLITLSLKIKFGTFVLEK